MPFRPSCRIARSASLTKAGPPHGRMVAKRIEHALVLLLHLGGVVAPGLHRGQLLVRALAAQVVRRVGDDADVDVVLLVRAEEILQHHRAAALAPFRPAVAVPGAQIVGGFFRRVDVRMPVDDHARSRSDCLSTLTHSPIDRPAASPRGIPGTGTPPTKLLGTRCLDHPHHLMAMIALPSKLWQSSVSNGLEPPWPASPSASSTTS